MPAKTWRRTVTHARFALPATTPIPHCLNHSNFRLPRCLCFPCLSAPLLPLSCLQRKAPNKPDTMLSCTQDPTPCKTTALVTPSPDPTPVTTNAHVCCLPRLLTSVDTMDETSWEAQQGDSSRDAQQTATPRPHCAGGADSCSAGTSRTVSDWFLGVSRNTVAPSLYVLRAGWAGRERALGGTANVAGHRRCAQEPCHRRRRRCARTWWQTARFRWPQRR